MHSRVGLLCHCSIVVAMHVAACGRDQSPPEEQYENITTSGTNSVDTGQGDSTTAACDNGVVDPGEDCESPNPLGLLDLGCDELEGYNLGPGGQLLCNEDCKFNTVDCSLCGNGTLDLNLSPVSVREVIEAAANGVRERLKQNDMTLDVAIEPGIDTFVADGARVTQILYNLLSNAIGFSPEGGRIALNCHRENSMLAFTVEDTGLLHTFPAL